MYIKIPLFLIAMFWSCGSRSLGPDSEDLSSVLSISNLKKQSIEDSSDPSWIVGLSIEVDVFNRSPLPIVFPFILTWSLQDGEGRVFGSVSRRLEGNLQSGASRHVVLTLHFPATQSLDQFQDVVTFDLVTS